MDVESNLIQEALGLKPISAIERNIVVLHRHTETVQIHTNNVYRCTIDNKSLNVASSGICESHVIRLFWY